MAGKENTIGGRRRPSPVSRRAIAYLRVSTAVQAEQGMGLDVQRDKVTKYAAAAGLELVDVVKEPASGGIREGEVFSWDHRPALHALLARAEAQGFDVLIVARYDRLSRDYMSLVALERRFRNCGAEIVSVAEEHNGDGPIGEFIRGQLALVAQLERAMIAERLSDGRVKAREAGRHAGGRVPYGYSSERGILTPVAELVSVVEGIFGSAADRRSPAKIARDLNEQGVAPPRAGAGWSRQAVTLILRNPAYMGERNGIKDAHPAIVDGRVWNAAQRGLEQRRRRPNA